MESNRVANRFEHCCNCGDKTGKSGKGDDSLYCEVCGKGPFCEDCWYICMNVHSMSAGGAGP